MWWGVEVKICTPKPTKDPRTMGTGTWGPPSGVKAKESTIGGKGGTLSVPEPVVGLGGLSEGRYLDCILVFFGISYFVNFYA